MTFRSSSSSYYLKSLPDLSSVYSYPLGGSQRSLISTLGQRKCHWSGPCKTAIIISIVLLCIWGIAAPVYLIVNHRLTWPFVPNSPQAKAQVMITPETTPSPVAQHATEILTTTTGPDEKKEENIEKPQCEGNHFPCAVDVCIPHQWVCDGVVDCKDASDETHESCKKEEKEKNGPTREEKKKLERKEKNMQNKQDEELEEPTIFFAEDPAPTFTTKRVEVWREPPQPTRRQKPAHREMITARPPPIRKIFRPILEVMRTTPEPETDDFDEMFEDMNGSNSGLIGAGKIKQNVIRKQNSRTEFFG